MRRPLSVGVVILAILLAACRFSGLSLEQDERVKVLAPPDRSEVSLPFELRWKIENYAGRFGVFVDRAPQPPEEGVAWLVRDDEDCRRQADCPTPEYLAALDVYVLSEASLRIEHVPEIDREGPDAFHEATIVLLDDRGRRVGESAFSVEFRVKRST